MIGRTIRSTLALGGALLALAAQPAQTQAFFHDWCGGCSWCGGRTTYRPFYAGYAPYAAGYGCGSCNPCPTACNSCPTACNPCAQQVCNYMPQTCYRTVYSQVPVTAYQPVTTCDPCTGCPRT